jgi:uncharacterized protein (DUF488 family)
VTIFTVGHARHPIDRFVALLRNAGVSTLADVRAWPRSRANPQFDGAALEAALAAAGIRYRHLGALGGRRGAQGLTGPSPHTLWEEPAFRNYADYALGSDFRAGLAALRALTAGAPTAVMCAEADWRRCHRRLIADALLAAGETVVHILSDGTREPATITSGAVVQPDGSVHYPGVQGELPFP